MCGRPIDADLFDLLLNGWEKVQGQDEICGPEIMDGEILALWQEYDIASDLMELLDAMGAGGLSDARSSARERRRSSSGSRSRETLPKRRSTFGNPGLGRLTCGSLSRMTTMPSRASSSGPMASSLPRCWR